MKLNSENTFSRGMWTTLVAGFLVSPLAALYAEPTAQMAEVLKTYNILAPVPLTKLAPAVARKAPSIAAAAKAVMLKEGKKAPPFTGTTKDIEIPTLGETKVDARVYMPAGSGPFPTIVYIHGGGWVIGDLDVYDFSPRGLCEMTKSVVVSIDYRKGPEYKFPAAHEDTFAAYKWVLANVSQYMGDPMKVALVGESAGGNMATSISLMAKEQNVAMPVYQVLVYPVADTSMDTKSYAENPDTKPLSAPAMEWFFKHYLGSPADGKNPHISLLNADLKGLPPTAIIAAEIDPLRSEGQALEAKFKEAGVPVEYRLYKGVTHEFFGMGAVIDEAKEAEEFAAAQLKTAFAK